MLAGLVVGADVDQQVIILQLQSRIGNVVQIARQCISY